ncbi:MAG: hypothetical protein J6W12_08195 [Bacteroidales bacterium]|nr:hypothetical protein [Bacteroidales bacterium]
MKRTVLFLSLIIAITFAACKKKETPQPAPQPADRGLFILNEGTFTYANSSLSYYDFATNTVENNLFFRVNNAPIGDVGQSLTLIGDDLYIVVNNSKYIYKVDAKTIVYKAKIEGFTSPRYMLQVSADKAYVTDLVSTGFWVLNLNTLEKTFVETGNTTEAIVKVGNEVFMSNWSNYYTITETSNHSIQVIDCVNDALVETIDVAQEPNSMVVDKYNHIWVSCSGGYMPPQDPAIICIDAATHQIIKRFDLAEGSYPSGLTIDGAGENIFFMNGSYGTLNIYKMSVDATEIPETPFVTSGGKVFYNLKVDLASGDLYVTDAKNYVQNGDLLHYSADGTLLGTYELGLIPSYMLFN